MQIVQQIQFIGMLSQIDIEWPDEWFTFTSVFNFVNLSFENIFGNPKVPTFSRRLIFILVSICIPLLINVLLLIIFQPMYVVLWYLCLCCGVVFLCAGLAGNFLPASGVSDAGASDPVFFMILGGALVGFALLTLLINKLIELYQGKDEEMAFTEEAKYFRRFHRKRALKHCAIFLLCLLVFLLCSRVIIVTIPRTNSQSAFDDPIIFVIGIIFGVLCVFALVYMVINWFPQGRKCTQKAEAFGKRNLLLVLLSLVSLSYIPTISYAVSVFMCRTYTCPAGTKFNPYADRPESSFDTSESRYCDPCAFNASTTPTCGRNVSLAYTYCPEYSESRSWRRPDITCADEATGYFYTAAALVLIIYMFGIPLLFLRVIQYLTGNVVNNARIGLVNEDEDANDVWVRQMAAIQPVASSLYDPFRLTRRYYTLVQLVHRLMITFTITVAAAYSRAAVVFVLILHAAVGAILVVAKPYVTQAEQVLALMLAVCNTLNAVYAIAVWRDSTIPSYTAYIFLILNGFIPAVGVLIGHIIARRYRNKKANEAEHARAVRQVRELEAKKEAGGDGAASASPAGAAVSTGYAGEPTSPSRHHYLVQEVTAADLDEEENEPFDDYYDSSDDPWAEDGSDDQTEEVDEETKRKVKKLMEMRRRHNERQQQVFDQHSTGTMNKAFMTMGVFFILALGIAFLGLMRTAESDFLVGSHEDGRGPGTVFAGYKTWDEFTAHCCCFQQTTPSPDFSIAERWSCANGKTVERGRVDKSGVSGLPIRSICSTSFNDQCTVTDTVTGVVVLTCPVGAPALSQTNALAQKLFW